MLDEHLQTLASGVMHDLGQYASKGKVPRMRDAQRFAAARAAEVGGISAAQVRDVASTAVRDWRATHRVSSLTAADPLSRAYLTGRGQIKAIGVRVVIELSLRRKRTTRFKKSATVLVNAQPGMTAKQVIAAAVAAWNARSIETPHGFESGSRATGHGEIVQLVEGGWSHSQVGA